MSEYLDIQFILDDGEEETVVGEGRIPHAPRIGEAVRLITATGDSWWRITDICYTVPDNGPCSSLYALVKPKTEQ